MAATSKNAPDLFLHALQRAPAERAVYLDEACAGDAALRQRVEALLRAYDEPIPFVSEAYPEAAGGTTGTFTRAEAEAAIIAGKYKLLQRIGEGGMGSVWMADQTEPVKRRVAVKLIRAEKGQSKTILSRFEAERQAIALMDHAHIARLLDAGTTDTGQPYFVMELVKGIPLTEFCDTQKLAIPERLQLFMQICSAVQHAHQKGIIHRDLKPTNILVENHDGKPVPKVIDFGLAKATTGLQLTEHTLFTAFGSVMGTPLYMAPEQANFNAADVDTRADIYALGVILYELLTGTTPISRETIKKAALDEMVKLIREQEAPTPSSRLSSSEAAPTVAANRQTEPARLGRFVKGELDWIVMKALAKERDRRYETAAGFARDIERFLSHEPVTAGPPTAAYRLRKFVRRNRPQVVGAALVLLALVLGVIGTTLGLVQANERRREAERARADEAEQRGLAEARQKKAEAETLRADANAQEAIDRYDLAVDALNVVFSKVQTELERSPATDRARIQILQAAMKVLQKSVEQGDRGGLSQRGMASAHMSLGNMMLEMGKRDEAAKEFDHCHRILSELYRSNPESDQAAFNYATSMVTQADLDRNLSRDLPAARKRYREALALQEDLLTRPRANPRITPAEIKAAMARSFQSLGDIAERLGPRADDDAEGLLDKALTLHEEIVAAEASARAKKDLAHAHCLLGDAQWRRQREAEAQVHYEAALPLCVAAVREEPNSARFTAELFNLCGNAGDKIFLHSGAAPALPFYVAAIGPAEQMAAGDGRPVVHRILAQNYYRLATAYLRLNDATGADANYAKCLAVREKLHAVNKDDNASIGLMIAQARCGQHEKAAALADDLLRRRPKQVGILIQAACCYALCSSAVAHHKTAAQLTSEDKAQQNQYSEQAIAALRNAQANGYKDVQNLKLEPDLDPIRADPRFRSLVAELRK
jgi:serine/threonine protein kinase